MTDKKTEGLEVNPLPKPKIRWLWPAMATAIAYPVFMALALALLLWLLHLFNPPFWLVASSFLLIALLGLYGTWRLMSAWAKRNFQFSLRGLLATMTVVAIVIGTAGQLLQQRRAVLELMANGAYPTNSASKKKNWLQSNLRYDPFNKVQTLNIRSDQAIPILLQHPTAFSELEVLSFSTGSTDASLKNSAQFNEFSQLAGASFRRGIPSNKGMQYLKDWTQVRSLHFSSSAFTDKGLAHLVNLPELETLSLIGDRPPGISITDLGLTHVGKLSYLKTLMLFDLPITDSGLEHLQNLIDLEELYIRRTNVTEEGLRKLAEAIPDCWINDDFTHFPLPFQIQQITVCKESPSRQQLLTITDPAQIAAIIEHLESLLKQYTGGWQREWEGKSAENISLDFESPNRRFFQISFENNFYYDDRGTRHPLAPSDANKLRRLLGVEETPQ